MDGSRPRLTFLRILFIGLLLVQPIFAERPPDGFARPPIQARPDVTSSPTGLAPTDVRRIYGFDQIANCGTNPGPRFLCNQGAGETIGIVDAFDDPNIESDLAVFSNTFGLPACTTANGCFQKIYANGRRPRSDAGWSLEIALDVEWAHAIAPSAKIVLVEAASNSFNDLIQAVDVAVLQGGASSVSMSFGGNEFSSQINFDNHFLAAGVTFTASSGDSGTGAEYPAASPNVIAVGGTTLNSNGETAWSGSGGGQSTYEVEPLYQANYPIPNDPNGKRGIPDVAYDANPNTGFPVYDTVKYQGQAGWFQVGGTSAGSPQWAALFAIVNSTRVANGLPRLGIYSSQAIYTAAATNYTDITTGTNGSCGTLCTATTGYDYVTGLGSPRAASLIPALATYNIPN